MAIDIVCISTWCCSKTNVGSIHCSDYSREVGLQLKCLCNVILGRKIWPLNNLKKKLDAVPKGQNVALIMDMEEHMSLVKIFKDMSKLLAAG